MGHPATAESDGESTFSKSARSGAHPVISVNVKNKTALYFSVKVTNSPITGPETKDFADHLRSVQFALVVVCLGLMVVTTSPGQRSISAAHQQILDILEISREWDPGWIQTEAQNRTSTTNKHLTPDQRSELEGPKIKAIQIGEYSFNTKFTGRFWVLVFPEEQMSFAGAEPIQPFPFKNSADYEFQLLAPATLNDFRKIWDALPKAFVETIKLRPDQMGSLERLKIEGGKILSMNTRLAAWKEIARSARYTEVDFRCANMVVDVAHPTVVQPGCFGVPRGSGSFMGLMSLMSVSLPVVGGSSIDLTLQRVLVARFPDRFRLGTFADVFRELDVATESYQDLPLETIEKIVRSERERSKDAFEAFGVRFPVEGTARWGLLVLLGTQLYFWLHLSEYRRRQIVNPAVAWIGSYDSGVARIVVSASTFVLPVVVAYFVAKQSDLTASKWFSRIAIVGVTSISCVIALLTASLYFKVPHWLHNREEAPSPPSASQEGTAKEDTNNG